MDVSQKIHAITYENLVRNELSLTQNCIKLMQKNMGNKSVQQLKASASLRERYESDLRIIVTPEVQYLYMLYYEKSDKGTVLRYLLDTSENEEERALFNQKFNPTTDIWAKAKASKKEQISTQKESDLLWSTLVVPIIENDEVVAAIGVDFAHKAKESIQEVVLPLESMYLYIAIFMIALSLTAYIQFVLYYKTHKKALVDNLTQIYNRQYLFDFLKGIKIKDYQILMLDIDYFKKVNDTYGHDIGDTVLISVAQSISRIIRKKDTFVRYGGEEFIILLYKQDVQQCQEVAHRILKEIENITIKTAENSIKVTLSIGINPYPEKYDTVDEAIKIADQQLYLAKTNGRNRVETFTLN